MRRSDGKGVLAEREGPDQYRIWISPRLWGMGRGGVTSIDEKRCGTRSSPHPFISPNLGPTYERQSTCLCLSDLTISTMYQVCIFNVLSLSHPPHRK